jgi:DNA-directed RNA polymerase specialized sigma24 family protein
MMQIIDQFAIHTDIDVVAILEQSDQYILALARRNVPRQVSSPETFDLEADELAQNTRIKFWQALQKKEQIVNTRAYVRCIVRNEAVNMVRAHKPGLPLQVDTDGELCCGNTRISISDGMQDPAYSLEQAEAWTDCVKDVAAAIHTLPPRQRQAMICSLKEQVDDVQLLSGPFRDFEMDIETAQWPEEKDDIQRLKASLSASRKKLRPLLEQYV